MTIAIPRAVYDGFGGMLETRIAGFHAALEAHRATEGIPAPIEDPIVEAIAKAGGGFTIEAPPTPAAAEPPPVPALQASITSTQLFLVLPAAGLATEAEAIAAAQTGAVPAAIDAVFAGLPAEQAFAARIRFARMTSIAREDPLVAALAAARSLTTAELDALFATAAAL
jgi:hypothetical protein